MIEIRCDKDILPIDMFRLAGDDVVWNRKGHKRRIPIERMNDCLRWTGSAGFDAKPPRGIKWEDTDEIPHEDPKTLYATPPSPE